MRARFIAVNVFPSPGTALVTISDFSFPVRLRMMKGTSQVTELLDEHVVGVSREGQVARAIPAQTRETDRRRAVWSADLGYRALGSP